MLRRVGVRPVERSAASHAAHGKYVQLCPPTVEIGIGFIPIDLGFHSPCIALRDEYLMPRQPHGKLSFLHVLANCSFSYLTLRHFLADSRPDPMCCVPLLTGSFLIALKNLIDKRNRRLQLPVRPTHMFSRLRQRAGNRIPDHSTMYLQLSGHAGDRAHSKLILPTDLFEYLHLGSPIQRTSPSGLTPEPEYPLFARVGQNKPPKWANSEYRNQPVIDVAHQGLVGFGQSPHAALFGFLL